MYSCVANISVSGSSSHVGYLWHPDIVNFTFNSYSYNTFILCQKALQASIKVSLRIDDDGFLSLQLMMPKPAFKELEGKDFGIIEFKMKALQDDDED